MINKNVNIIFKTAIVIVAIFFVTANVIAQTIVVPDAIFPEGPTRSPANEQIANAIDKNPQTKFLNFHKIGSGFTVVFQTPVVINEIQFTTANDDYGRDPLEVIISGSSESMNSGFSEIATVSLPKTAARFTPYGNTFTNATAYKYYRVIVTAIDKPTAGAVQFAEVDFFKSGSPINSTQPTVVTQPVAPIDPSGGEVAQLNARVAELEGKLSAATATLSRQQGSEKHPSMSSRELDDLYEEMKRCDEREGQRNPEMCLMQLPSLVSYRYESIKNMCAQDGASTECDGNLKSIEMTYLIGSWVKQKGEMRENRTKERVREMQRRAAERKRNDPDGSKAALRRLKRDCRYGIKKTDGPAREWRCKKENKLPGCADPKRRHMYDCRRYDKPGCAHLCPGGKNANDLQCMACFDSNKLTQPQTNECWRTGNCAAYNRLGRIWNGRGGVENR